MRILIIDKYRKTTLLFRCLSGLDISSLICFPTLVNILYIYHLCKIEKQLP